MDTVYPRSRGERDSDQAEPGTMLGLSPLARGTAIAPLPESPSTRFIPARAGNGSSFPAKRSDKPVYPRSRGERFGNTPPA